MSGTYVTHGDGLWTQPERVLLADVDNSSVRLLSFSLQDEGFEVIKATSAREALRIAREQRIDAVLAELGLYDMSGEELCRKLRADWSTRYIPIILTTSMGGPEDRAHGLLAGADDFLIKPYDMRELMIRLHRLTYNSSNCGRLHQITKLPGSQLIKNYVEEVCIKESERTWAVLEIDINNFRAYNQVSGFEAGDHVLSMVGDLLRRIIHGKGNDRSFVGHEGNARFLAVVPLHDVQSVSQDLLFQFNKEVSEAYPLEHSDTPYQVLIDRKGNTTHVPRIALSIGIVTGDLCDDLSYLDLRDAGAAVLSQAKKEAQSSLFMNRRRLKRQEIAQKVVR